MAVGVRAWLLRRDPGLVAVRRAVRVAAIACVGFYVGRYLVHDPVMATYALFATIAMGFLSQIPGPAARRSVILLLSLPVACLLVTAGTVLAGNLWAATAGMLVFGFFIAYASVGGPRVVGLTGGIAAVLHPAVLSAVRTGHARLPLGRCQRGAGPARAGRTDTVARC